MDPLRVALSQVGIKETRGQQDNPEVLKYFNRLGFDGSKLKDETAWCAAFIGWVLEESGFESTKKLTARSYLDFGLPTPKPEIGDIVVLWRESPDSWKGHVGLFISETPNGWIQILGGNQSNAVKISAYRKSRLLGYRKIV